MQGLTNCKEAAKTLGMLIKLVSEQFSGMRSILGISVGHSIIKHMHELQGAAV